MSNQATKNIWYKNYMMLVFVIGLPAFTVMVCIFFIIYALKIQDSTVRDNWYMDGKALYQDASKDKLAYDIGVAGIMHFDGGEVYFELNYPTHSTNTGTLANGSPISYPDTLRVSISHATDKTADRDFVLSHQDQNRYTGHVELQDLPSKYYLNIHPESDQPEHDWRLTQTHKLPTSKVAFFPLPAFANQPHPPTP